MIGKVFNWAAAVSIALAFVVLAAWSAYTEGTRHTLLPKDHAFQGTLHLTLARSGGEPRLYSFNLSTGRLSKEKNITPFTDITKRISADGAKVAVATAYASEKTMTINTLDLATGAFAIASRNELPYKREPVWSSGGSLLAYAGTDTEVAKTPETWTIFVADAAGAGEGYIGNGTSPLFSPDGSALLFLKSDGLYIARAQVPNASTLVWPAKNVTADMKLALSADGSKLAWSNPVGKGGLGEVVVFGVSWDPFFVRPIWEYRVPATYVAFSPDGATLAALVFDYVLSPVAGPQLVLITLESGAVEPALALREFSPGFAWLSQWSE